MDLVRSTEQEVGQGDAFDDMTPVQQLSLEELSATAQVDGRTTGRNETSHLIGHWELDESSGIIIDSSGNGHTGTAYGGPTYGVEGVIGTALGFDGTNDYIDLNHHIISLPDGGVSFCMWAKNEITVTQPTALWGTDGGDEWRIILLANGSVHTSIRGTGGDGGITAGNIGEGVWHHICSVYDDDAGVLQLYMDGSLIGSEPVNLSAFSQGMDQFLGCMNKAGSCRSDYAKFQGAIDSVVLYGRVLLPSHIYDYYITQDAALSDPDADSDGWFDYEEDQCDSNKYNSTSVPSDVDGDGSCDQMDSDADDDGWQNDDETDCLTDWLDDTDVPLDTDGDWECDRFDVDDDDDGVLDADDACPFESGTSTNDRFGCIDSDGDGYSDPTSGWTVDDGADEFKDDPSQWVDANDDSTNNNTVEDNNTIVNSTNATNTKLNNNSAPTGGTESASLANQQQSVVRRWNLDMVGIIIAVLLPVIGLFIGKRLKSAKRQKAQELIDRIRFSETYQRLEQIYRDECKTAIFQEQINQGQYQLITEAYDERKAQFEAHAQMMQTGHHLQQPPYR